MSPETEGHPDPPGYEQARAELEQVVRALEQGSATLEQTLALWERGEQLANICEAWLDGAQVRLAALVGRTGPDDSAPDN